MEIWYVVIQHMYVCCDLICLFHLDEPRDTFVPGEYIYDIYVMHNVRY
jgi:hypothetical protein